MIKSQDIMVALKLSLYEKAPAYAELAKGVGMSVSETHASVKRLVESQLVDFGSRSVHKGKLRNFIIHGLSVMLPAKPQEITRGIPTGWAAPIMEDSVKQSETLPPVWPDPEGKVRGAAIKPLYKSVINVAKSDAALYALLALVDAIRIGRARERNYAEKKLSQLLKSDE